MNCSTVGPKNGSKKARFGRPKGMECPSGPPCFWERAMRAEQSKGVRCPFSSASSHAPLVKVSKWEIL